jgi:hypothetical protein
MHCADRVTCCRRGILATSTPISAHSVNVKIGGFYRVPGRAELAPNGGAAPFICLRVRLNHSTLPLELRLGEPR